MCPFRFPSRSSLCKRTSLPGQERWTLRHLHPFRLIQLVKFSHFTSVVRLTMLLLKSFVGLTALVLLLPFSTISFALTPFFLGFVVAGRAYGLYGPITLSEIGVPCRRGETRKLRTSSKSATKSSTKDRCSETSTLTCPSGPKR